MSAPFRAIVGRFSYPFTREVIERVFGQLDFEFCAILSAEPGPNYFAGLPEGSQQWFYANELRGGLYRDTDFNDLAPLDEALIEAMRPCEAVFMDMVERLEWKRSISYQERLRMYYVHLRFWNDYLERERINLYVSAWIPHEIPDIVIYHLCKHKGIKVLYYHTSTVRDISFAETDIEESATELQAEYEKLLKEYANVDAKDIELEELFADRFAALTAPAGQKPPLESFRHKTYWQHIKNLVAKNPLKLLWFALAYVCTPKGWARAYAARQRRTVIAEREEYYAKHAVEPDYSKKFVYFPLHFQPEASSVPMGGIYSDQVLTIQLLSKHVPSDVLIYVKEHYKPSSWICRTKEHYEALTALPNVRLVSMSCDTFDLREHCTAVATLTGSAGFEALFREKPVLLFGHRYYQYARGVHRIRSEQDLTEATKAVFEQGSTPTLKDAKLYLKAMESTGVRGVLNPWHLKVTNLPEAKHIEANVESLTKELSSIL